MSLTVPQVAKKLGLSTRTVNRRIASGEIPALKLGEGKKAPVRILEKDLNAYIKRNKIIVQERIDTYK